MHVTCGVCVHTRGKMRGVDLERHSSVMSSTLNEQAERQADVRHRATMQRGHTAIDDDTASKTVQNREGRKEGRKQENKEGRKEG